MYSHRLLIEQREFELGRQCKVTVEIARCVLYFQDAVNKILLVILTLEAKSVLDFHICNCW